MAMSSSYTLFLVCYIILANNGYCSKSDSSAYKSFLTNFLNLSMHQIGKLSNSFQDIEISNDDIKFLLFNKYSQNPKTIDQTKVTLQDPTREIIILIHGWTDNGLLPWIRKISRTYYEVNDDRYIISIDWTNPANLSYPASATAAQGVGIAAAEILWKIIGKNQQRLKDLHVIGHSLGAHVAGFLGQHIQVLSGFKISRITGLDPANPLFMFKTQDLRLSSDDADFVDCYHTDSGFRGQSRPIGHVDVYFNCEKAFQPGCLGKNIITQLNDASSCSHQEVHKFFTNTIKYPRIYVSKMCYIDVKLLHISGQDMKFSLGNVYAGEYVYKGSLGTFCASTTGSKPAKSCSFFV